MKEIHDVLRSWKAPEFLANIIRNNNDIRRIINLTYLIVAASIKVQAPACQRNKTAQNGQAFARRVAPWTEITLRFLTRRFAMASRLPVAAWAWPKN
jgi:hypothetical protein